MKVGMLPIWDKWGCRIPTTVLQLDACQVVQVKQDHTDGYTSIQLGVGEAKLKNVKKPQLGHYNKAGVVPNRKLVEFKVTPDAILPVGTKIRAMHFVPGQLIDVCGTSKGKGFCGAMKRWNFGGGRASHGNSLSHRVLGSIGCRQDPGRVFKGKKMPGRMGTERITVQNLKIVKIDPSRDLIYVHGAVPGNNGSFLRLVDAVKGPFYPSPAPFPSFLLDETDAAFPRGPLFAPISETDNMVPIEPDDPF